MALIHKSKFAELAQYKNDPCISFFLPTHRAGVEVNEGQDQIRLKNHVQYAKNQLEERGLDERDINQMLQPARDLITNDYFWRHLSDGLAFFIAPDFFEYYALPIRFEDFDYIDDTFYLRPLMPMYNGDGHFFLLTLSQDGTRFFEGTRHTITEMQIDELVPEELRDVVGYDYEEKSLQWRSNATGMSASGSMFHGQGRNTSDDKNEIKRYCRAINDGLMEILHDQSAPLIIACVDYLFPIYQEVNDYKHLYPQHLSGNPEEKKPTELHEQAWEVVRSQFQQQRQNSLDQFSGFLAYNKASNDIKEIVGAAMNGRVDTLFLQNRTDAYGTFNPSNYEVKVEDAKHKDNTSLLNLAAIQTFLQEGKVYLLEPSEMPDQTTKVSAIFRY